jgi:hypothetical protein
MRRAVWMFSMSGFFATIIAASAAAQTATWQRVNGIALANNVVGSGTGAVAGGFLPWNTLEGKARVNLQTGETHFFVRGLVFAAGAPGITIGTPGPITAVKGTLLCDPDGKATGNSVLVETPSVPLTSTGDAKFTGNFGPIPAVCFSQPVVFLVRAAAIAGNPVEGPWLANGAVFSTDADRDGD